ncbi:AAA family ATPase [Parabacteroides goldsteinii]|uniref:AAA family ATPase n=1 Tax=Parabacteroides goldsteinii TaxID=328812 RepID=A0A6G1ZFC6_9BACT|nr:AAA family ATPase [Parabacteroides goldsteinii]MRX92815.1 AAA family ATPase [Parabacteroides goldsteinii]MRX98188.1 AAA family ATPase [Parabacteroides goldsteinii]MRY03564.1 AAA family ATPase [Parabacteroides goldsteinii]MRY12629.1 AAA family ATPase [Parabacteroides goldsteinii]MRY22631.1 AAA family ATPase [Parabacteroides goldsteinii]
MERISVTDFGPIQHAEIEIKPFCILIGHTSSGKSTVAKLLDLFNSQEFYFIEPKDNLVPFISLLKKYDIDFDFKEHTCIVYKKGEYTWTISKKGIETDYPFTDIANEWYHGNVLFTKSHRPFRARIIKLLNLLNEDIRLPELQNFEHIEQFPDEKIRDNQYIQFYSRLMHTYVYNEIPSVYIPAERILMSVLSKAIFSFYEKGINIPDCLKIFANKYSLVKTIRNSTK